MKFARLGLKIQWDLLSQHLGTKKNVDYPFPGNQVQKEVVTLSLFMIVVFLCRVSVSVFTEQCGKFIQEIRQRESHTKSEKRFI